MLVMIQVTFRRDLIATQMIAQQDHSALDIATKIFRERRDAAANNNKTPPPTKTARSRQRKQQKDAAQQKDTQGR